MIINSILKKEADSYFDDIAVNDFYSFTKSEFKNNILLDLSEEKAIKDKEASEQFIKRVNQLKSECSFSYDDTVVADAIIGFCKYIENKDKFYWQKFDITHNTSPLPYVIKALELYDSSDKRNLDDYIELISQLPKCVEGMRKKLIVQENMKILLPIEQCNITIKMLEGLLQDLGSKLRRPEKSIQIDKIIEKYNEEVNKTISYIKNNYKVAKKDSFNLYNRENGEEYYRFLINTFTSYDYKPEEIHEIGINSIKNTREKMQKIIDSLGFKMSIEEFNQYINKKPEYLDKTPNDLLNRMNKFLFDIKPKLKDYFEFLPKTECEVRQIEKSRESSTSWGYYAVPVGTDSKGVYYFSGAELEKRCQIRAGAIVFHELMPGHHFQMSLIAEDKSLPKICNQHFNTAYADGWAEYSADLANEMGLYNEYDLYGRYLWDLVLSTRLVVDTGVNALGWSLDKVRDFMRKNTTLTESEIDTESLRYSADMPGQALAYKMGSLKMAEMRNKSQQILKDKFDIKKYHDTVLKYGSINLSLVEKNVDKYIEDNK